MFLAEVVQSEPMPAWLFFAMLLGVIVFAVVLQLVTIYYGAPAITGWLDRPNGRQPAMVNYRGKQYLCLPVEDELNSYQRLSDILEAAEGISEERRDQGGR